MFQKRGKDQTRDGDFLSYRKDFGANNHNYACNKEEKEQSNCPLNFFRDPPRCDTNTNHILQFDKDNPQNTMNNLKSSIAGLLDLSQELLDEECEKQHLPFFLQDELMNIIFVKPIRKSLSTLVN